MCASATLWSPPNTSQQFHFLLIVFLRPSLFVRPRFYDRCLLGGVPCNLRMSPMWHEKWADHRYVHVCRSVRLWRYNIRFSCPPRLRYRHHCLFGFAWLLVDRLAPLPLVGLPLFLLLLPASFDLMADGLLSSSPERFPCLLQCHAMPIDDESIFWDGTLAGSQSGSLLLVGFLLGRSISICWQFFYIRLTIGQLKQIMNRFYG